MLAILSNIEYKVANIPNLIDGVPDLVDGKVKNRGEEIPKVPKNTLLVFIMSNLLV